EAIYWRWSHARHHTDTLIVGRDPEIAAMRPPKLIKIIVNFVGLVDVPVAFFSILLHATGRLTPDEHDYIPEMEQHKVFVVARVWVAIYVAVIASCFWINSAIPLALVPGGRLYGAWHFMLCGLTQHAGMAEDVFDHRLNSRTVYMNPISRFIYWNMNYHVEHHMFPMVPYHRLPELHAATKHDCPEPYRGFAQAYAEIIPTIVGQLRDQHLFVHRRLPETARPFRPDLHDIPGAAPAE
ncbi:MAG: fatty acid desaturase, partial [Cucumibacter sp.]